MVKKRFSAFMSTGLDSALRRLGVTRVVMCGVQTPNCIRATAYDAVCLDYPQVRVSLHCCSWGCQCGLPVWAEHSAGVHPPPLDTHTATPPSPPPPPHPGHGAG